MKRRVLRAKANKKILRQLTSKLGTKCLPTPVRVVADASFLRMLSGEENVASLVSDAFEGSPVALFYSPSTLRTRMKAEGENDWGMKNMKCLYVNSYKEDMEKREERALVELFKSFQLPGSKTVTFLATQSHDIRRVFHETLPEVPLIRATLQPAAVWLEPLRTFEVNAPAKTAHSSELSEMDKVFLGKLAIEKTIKKSSLPESVKVSQIVAKEEAEPAKKVKKRDVRGPNPLSVRPKAPKPRFISSDINLPKTMATSTPVKAQQLQERHRGGRRKRTRSSSTKLEEAKSRN